MILAVWLSEIKRHKQRLRQVRERALVGKILGIVGTGAGLGRNALRIQEKALRGLGLKPAGLVTQVIQRDIHAEVVAYFALLGSSLDKFATEIRNLQRSEIAEALEPFDRMKQVGSSALPSKRNPNLSERASSLAKLLRALAIPALENVPLWHERDLSNSANERFLFPMSFILTDEMLLLALRVLKGLEVSPKNMERNLELSQGAVLASCLATPFSTSMLTILSARTAPWDNSRLRSIFFGDTSSPFRTLSARRSISSVRMKDIGKRKRSFAELDRSRSCQSGTFSKAGIARALSSLAKLDARSLRFGFRFEGSAELPTCFSRSNGSSASAISLR